MVEMEEGGRDKTPVQSQQPSATAPAGADEKSSGKERRDAGDKDKEQELVRRSFGSPGRRPWAESLLCLEGLGPDSLRPTAPGRHRMGRPYPDALLITHC